MVVKKNSKTKKKLTSSEIYGASLLMLRNLKNENKH